MSKIRPVYGVANEDFVAMLNRLKQSRPEAYAEVAPIIDELNNLATGGTISYNDFADQEEKSLFKEHFRKTYSLVMRGKGDSLRIFASDPKYVPELAFARLKLRLEKYPLLAEPKSFRKGKLDVDWNTPTSTIGSLIHKILELAQRGSLVRVRQCARCGDWFYAQRYRTRFCKKMCAKLHWQSSEIGKAKRRKYIRTYMRKYRKKYS